MFQVGSQLFCRHSAVQSQTQTQTKPEAFWKQHLRKLLVTLNFFALSNQQNSHKIDPQNFSEPIDQMTWQIPDKPVTLIDYICGRGNRLNQWRIEDFPDVGRQLLNLGQKAIFTARKRSLRRLCFYTCLSFCPRGWGACVAGGVHGRGATHTPPQTTATAYGQWAGGTHPTGMHFCFGKIFAQNGMKMKEIGLGRRPNVNSCYSFQ